MKIKSMGRNGIIAELTYQDVQIIDEALTYYAYRQVKGRLWSLEGTEHVRRLLSDFLYRRARFLKDAPFTGEHPVYAYRAPLFPWDDPADELLFGDRNCKWGLVPKTEE
jgi:hypothetical protein